jgi:hypothetical protein
MTDKGHHPRLAAQFVRQSATFKQQSLMPQMHPIKKTKGKDRLLFHISRN